MWPGFDSRSRRHMWVEFVVGSRLCSEVFSPGTLVFLPPQKPTFPNSISIWKQPSGSKSHSVDSTEIHIYFILLSFLQSFAMKSDPLLKNISRAFRQSFGCECVEFVREEPETPTPSRLISTKYSMHSLFDAAIMASSLNAQVISTLTSLSKLMASTRFPSFL